MTSKITSIGHVNMGPSTRKAIRCQILKRPQMGVSRMNSYVFCGSILLSGI